MTNGSDLAQVATKAVPQPDGTYKLSGTKIFISCGDHDMADNIMHCVLARLPDAPAGTRGISLFLVPKRKVSDSGEIDKKINGVSIGRIEDKMGCHGSPTCEINFEDAEGCVILRAVWDCYLVGRCHLMLTPLCACPPPTHPPTHPPAQGT